MPQTQDIQEMSHADWMRSRLPINGSDIVDVGCGDGSLVRFFAREGAQATGIECYESTLARANAHERVADEEYHLGFGQDIPLEDKSADVVIFANSLHHVPIEEQENALREAGRILRADGLLCVREPLAQGPSFEAHKLIDDETEVRFAAHKAIWAIRATDLFEEIDETFYRASACYADPEAFITEIVNVDETRAPLVERLRNQLIRNFERIGERRDDGWYFDQPYRVNLLRRSDS